MPAEHGEFAGQLLTRALGSPLRSGLLTNVLPVPLVPDGHTIRQDQRCPSRMSGTVILMLVTNLLERLFVEERR